MKRKIKKIIGCLVISVITCLISVLPAYAYYSDTEASESKMVSGSLKINIKDSLDFSPQLNPDVFSTRTVELEKAGTIDFVYTVSVENTSGDLCSNLNLKDDTTNILQSLASFTTDKIDFSVKPSEVFSAELVSDAAEWQSKSCDFELVFKASQKGLASGGFTDTKRISAKIESGKWIINSGDIVINELMWMGSYMDPNDEWIELRNTTSFDIDISGFQLSKIVIGGAGGGGKDEVLMLEIPAGSIIPANGFFVISKLDKASSKINVDPNLVDLNLELSNNNLQIKLYKADWTNSDNLIDTADEASGQPAAGDTHPAAGYQGIFYHFSMERNDIPGDGSLDANWHTCLEFNNTRIYWDNGDIFDYGTPGAPNLSDELDSLLQSFIDDEQRILSEGKYEPDLLTEPGEENVSYFEQGPIPTFSAPLPEEIVTEEEPLIEEIVQESGPQEPQEPVEEIIQEPAPEEPKIEEPVILETLEENNNEASLEQPAPAENQPPIEESIEPLPNSDNGTTDQNNIETNEI